VPILLGISREHYAMHANQLFIDRSGVPHAHVECASCLGTLDRKCTLFKLIVKFFLKGVVFMFWYDIAYVELLYFVTNFELVWTWNKVAVVENATKVSTVPHLPLPLRYRHSKGLHEFSAGLTIVANVAIATGPALLGAPRSSVINLIYYIIYRLFFSLRCQYFAKCAISIKRRFSIECYLCPEILVWFFLYSYVTIDIRLRSAVLPF